MPIYEYQHTGQKGDTCAKNVEIFQKMSDDALETCPVCGQPVEKLLSRFSGGGDKMAPSRLKDLGFSKWKRRDKGVYEKE